MKKITCLPLALAISVAVPVLGNELTIEAVVVTAQKRVQNSQEVPIAIDVFTEAEIKNRQIGGVADLAVSTPGVKFGEFVGAANDDLAGNPLSRVPDWTLVLGAEYEADLFGGALLLRADLLASNSYQTREFNNPGDEQDRYHNLNLVATYTGPSENW